LDLWYPVKMLGLKSLSILICTIVTISQFNFGSCTINYLPYFTSLSYDSGSNILYLIGGYSLYAFNVSSTSSPYICKNLYEVDTSYHLPTSVVAQNLNDSYENILFVSQNRLYKQIFSGNFNKYDCESNDLNLRDNFRYNQIVISPSDSNILFATIDDDDYFSNYSKIIKINIKYSYYTTIITSPCQILSFTVTNNRLFWIQSYSGCTLSNSGVYTSNDDGSSVTKATYLNYYFTEIAVYNYIAYLFTSNVYYKCYMDFYYNINNCNRIFTSMSSLFSPVIGNNSLYFISLGDDYSCSYTYKYNFYDETLSAVIMPSNKICQFDSRYYYSDAYICQQTSTDSCYSHDFPTSAIIAIAITCFVIVTVFILCCALYCKRRSRSNVANTINRTAYRPVSTVPSGFPGAIPNVYRNSSSVNTENSALISNVAPPPYSEVDLTRSSAVAPPPAINPYNSMPPQMNNIRSSLPAPIISNNVVPTMIPGPNLAPNVNRLTVKFCFNCGQPIAHGFTICTACGTNLLQLPT